MPLELRPETEAYRLCQPMHVLSFGEGRLSGKGCVFAFAALGWFVQNKTVRLVPRSTGRASQVDRTTCERIKLRGELDDVCVLVIM
jgi:hypothetical protein